MNQRTTQTGQFCVSNFEVVVASTEIGEMSSNGVLGLAPSHGDNSIIKALQTQGAFPNGRAIVGLNFENPIDTDQKSTISLGGLNFHEVKGGENGLNYYKNMAVGMWGLFMDDFKYNDQDVNKNGHAMIALIDSGNTSIQVP